MNQTSFRREYLDACLYNNRAFFKGKVLDIGGKKSNRRGKFIPPFDQVDSWHYLNNDIDTAPDYCCDAENIPLDQKSIDTILMTEILEYLPNPNKVFTEAHRVLKVNGYLLISTPLLNPVHGDYWIDRMRHTAASLREMAELAGFEVQSIEPMGSVGAVIYDILRVAGGYASKTNRRSITGLLLPFFRPLFYLIEKLYHSQKEFINTGYFLVAIKK